MRFEIDMKIDEDEVIKLIWDVPEKDAGGLDWESAGDMQVYEREVSDDDAFNAIKELFKIMIMGYYEDGDGNAGEQAENETDEG